MSGESSACEAHMQAHAHGACMQACTHGAHTRTCTRGIHAGTRSTRTRSTHGDTHGAHARRHAHTGHTQARRVHTWVHTRWPSLPPSGRERGRDKPSFRQKLQGLGCPEYPAPTQEPVKGVRADLVVVSCAPPGRPRPARLSHAGPESPLTTHCAVLPSKSSCLHRADSGGGLQPEAHSPAPGRAAMWSDFGKDVLFPQLLSMLPSPAQAGGEWGWGKLLSAPESHDWG